VPAPHLLKFGYGTIVIEIVEVIESGGVQRIGRPVSVRIRGDACLLIGERKSARRRTQQAKAHD
jgi:hypothetical protein